MGWECYPNWACHLPRECFSATAPSFTLHTWEAKDLKPLKLDYQFGVVMAKNKHSCVRHNLRTESTHTNDRSHLQSSSISIFTTIQGENFNRWGALQ